MIVFGINEVYRYFSINETFYFENFKLLILLIQKS